MHLAIVTGGSRGIGKALIDQYQDAEWNTLELSRSGTGLHHVAVDLANLDASFEVLEAQFQTLAKTPWERVVFVNNAGLLTPIGSVDSLADQKIEYNLTVNFVSAIRILSAFVRSFKTTLSRITIVNVSSGAAFKGYAGWSLYCASKAGMDNYIRALAAEQSNSPNPIVCINIEPGVVDTEMQTEIRQADPANFPDVGRFIDLKATGQLRSPKSVARAIMSIVDSRPENGGRYRLGDQA